MRATIFLLALLVPAAASAAELEAGIARVEITPSTFMSMYGYSNRKCGPANGTHDPLFAKVLVLETGDSRMALVTTDLGSLVSDNLRRDVASKLGIPVLLLSASHTHSAPAFLPFGSAPATGDDARAYLADVERKIFGAIEAASRAMFPARLGVPDLRSAAHGGYGADASTRSEVGAGEKIMLRHLTFLYELLGMWKDKPGRP
jgi:neutral ceramidase